MKQNLNLCMGCMNRKDYSGPCEICGYAENAPYPARCLPPGTTLSDRYVVGRSLSYNGEGVFYIAYDSVEDKIVELREYLPDTLCTRRSDTEGVVVNDGCLPLYKSYLSEFADLYKTLMNNNESESIRRVYGIFAANNTGYVVMEHLGGNTLSEYLEKNGGVMSWQDGRNSTAPSVRELFPPLLTALNLLHSHGIIHRGISLDSIHIDERGRLKLTAFGTSASRTEGSSISCQLFAGCAAPEQYDVSERQGTWTDIYGICAVLYRVLTGVQPQEANSRLLNDELAEPAAVNPSVPRGVSDAIMAGMSLKQENRIRTVNELVERIFGQTGRAGVPEDDGPIVPAVAPVNQPEREMPSVRRSAPQRRPAQKSKKKKDTEKSNLGTIVGASVFLAIVAGFIIAIAYFSQAASQLQTQQTTTEVQEFPPLTTEPPATTTPPPVSSTTATTTPASSVERILLPDFVNRFYNQLENRYSMLKFNPVYEYNDEYPEGIVFDQDIEPDTEVVGGTEINVKVSKGPASVLLPDFIGKKLEEYTAELSEAGIKYDTEPEETSEFKEGYVSGCSKNVGDTIILSRDEKVIVYYAVKPPETEPPETEPEDDGEEEIEPEQE